MDIKIDKLKICYKAKTSSLINILRTNPKVDINWKELGFALRRISGTHYDYIYDIVYSDYSDNKFEKFNNQIMGTISFGFRADKDESLKDFVWLKMDNRQFYVGYNYEVDNRTIYIDYVTDILGLDFNNITSLDLAVDGQVDFSKKIIRLLRNESYVPIINGKKIENRKEEREEILYLGIGNLVRIKRYNLSIKQKKALKDKSVGLSLMAYNKNKEIECSKKAYIQEVYAFPKRLHRLEVRINRESIMTLLTNEGIGFTSDLLWNKNFLWFVFLTFLNRLIRFQSVEGRKVYGVLDLI